LSDDFLSVWFTCTKLIDRLEKIFKDAFVGELQSQNVLMFVEDSEGFSALAEEFVDDVLTSLEVLLLTVGEVVFSFWVELLSGKELLFEVVFSGDVVFWFKVEFSLGVVTF